MEIKHFSTVLLWVSMVEGQFFKKDTPSSTMGGPFIYPAGQQGSTLTVKAGTRLRFVCTYGNYPEFGSSFFSLPISYEKNEEQVAAIAAEAPREYKKAKFIDQPEAFYSSKVTLFNAAKFSFDLGEFSSAVFVNSVFRWSGQSLSRDHVSPTRPTIEYIVDGMLVHRFL